jgi:hypothetical protein
MGDRVVEYLKAYPKTSWAYTMLDFGFAILSLFIHAGSR